MKTTMGISLILSMVLCPKCNKDNPEEATFCISCGHRLDDRHAIDRIKLDMKSAHQNWILCLICGTIGSLISAPLVGFGAALGSIPIIIPGIVALIAGLSLIGGFAFYAIKERKLDKELREFFSCPPNMQ